MPRPPLVVLSALLAIGCHRSGPVESQPAQPSVPAIPIKAGDAATAPTEEAGADGPASPRTPGRVQCGSGAVCDVATQVCCVDPPSGSGVCKRRPGAGADVWEACRDTGKPAALACDDASDCGKGQACCVQDLASGDVSMHAYECADYPCNVSEVCLPGGPCSRPELSCRDAGELFSGGTCELTEAKASCGSITCRGDTPVCCWEDKNNKGRCVADVESCLVLDEGGFPSGHEVALACSTPDDCGGYPCAVNGMMNPMPLYHCASRWAAGDMGWAILCNTAADCPDYTPSKKLVGCEGNSDAPPWLKWCEYKSDSDF